MYNPEDWVPGTSFKLACSCVKWLCAGFEHELTVRPALCVLLLLLLQSAVTMPRHLERRTLTVLHPSGDQYVHHCNHQLVAGHCVQCDLAVQQLHPVAGSAGVA